MRYFLTLLFLVSLIQLSSSQALFDLERDYSVPVVYSGEQLQNAWAGGFNAPQVSRIDLNLDGKLDLFIFDRRASRILTFLNMDDNPGEMNYLYTREFNDRFPVMSEWCLLRDFNCDGKVDIFTKAPNSITVYENVSTPESGLTFELRAPLLFAEYNYSGVPFNAPVFSVTVDIPSIHDHDGDGDLDILSFSEIASTVYYYKNYAVESGNCDTLAYELVNRCYGFFSEASEDNTLFLGPDHNCDFNVIEPRSGVHTGGTLLSLDSNNDGLLELIVADVSFNEMVMLVNGPSAQGPDSMYSVVPLFPSMLSDTEPVDIVNFPAGYYEDVNNDGIKDLLIAPNNPNQCDDDESLWLYLNNGLNGLPEFELIQYNFLQHTMMDFGRGAYPIVVDYNGDGLSDLFVANDAYYQEGPQPPSRIALFENTGTAEQPEYTLVTLNYLELDQYNLMAMYPAFGDLDGDGDLDLLIGDQGGSLRFFRNQAGAGNPFDFLLDTPNYADAEGNPIDVGQFATPQFFDLDNDGLDDLLIGEKNGNINYYRNTGSPELPAFTLEEDSVGDVIASNYLGINGYSVPHFFRKDGTTYLLLGTEKGYLNYFGNIDNNLEGSWELYTEVFAGINDGDRSSCYLSDLNNDGLEDLLYGQVGGGLAFFMGQDTVINVNEISLNQQFLELFPNPAENQFTVSWKGVGNHSNQRIKLSDSTGRLVFDQAVGGRESLIIDVSGYPSGIYIVTYQSDALNASQKLLLK